MRALLSSRPILGILPLLLVGLLGYRLVFPVNSGQTEEAARSTQREYEVGGLVVAAKALQFGEVWEKKGFTWEVPIRNVTKEPIEITDWFLSCNCSDIQPKTLRIPAGQTATARLTVDLTVRKSHEATQSRRPVAYEITPVLGNNKPRRQRWKVEGTVLSKVTVNALYIHFGESPVRGESPVWRKLVGTVHVPFKKLAAVADAKRLAVRLRQLPDNPARFELHVSPQPDMPAGPFRSDVILEIIAADGSREQGLTLPVEGEMQPAVRLLPARLLLPTKQVGEEATGILILQAPPRLSVVVEQIESESADVHVEATSADGVPPGRGFRVSWRIVRAGGHTSRVTFTLRSGKERMRIPVEVFARGEETAAKTKEKGKR
jgi:hypothetical protein